MRIGLLSTDLGIKFEALPFENVDLKDFTDRSFHSYISVLRNRSFSGMTESVFGEDYLQDWAFLMCTANLDGTWTLEIELPSDNPSI